MKDRTTHQQVGQAVQEGWLTGGGFFESIVAGFLVGLAADTWLHTRPLLIIVGIVLGAVSGYTRLWRYAKEQEERELRRRGIHRP